jgi:hypothetical protein
LSERSRLSGGASPDRFMVQLAMQQNDESGSPATWDKRVTDEQYVGGRSACTPTYDLSGQVALVTGRSRQHQMTPRLRAPPQLRK